ncbi:MAG: hypothetical protein M5U26_08510 [Planctomycetota bacterium]|nr:hypothetical protein [Planctomycetota bacterium]
MKVTTKAVKTAVPAGCVRITIDVDDTERLKQLKNDVKGGKSEAQAQNDLHDWRLHQALEQIHKARRAVQLAPVLEAKKAEMDAAALHLPEIDAEAVPEIKPDPEEEEDGEEAEA